jgi:hypothetical protein
MALLSHNIPALADDTGNNAVQTTTSSFSIGGSVETSAEWNSSTTTSDVQTSTSPTTHRRGWWKTFVHWLRFRVR